MDTLAGYCKAKTKPEYYQSFKQFTVPYLKTERLILRSPLMDDWPAYLNLMESPRSHFMGGPVSERFVWGIFCHDVAQWKLLGHGALMIEDRSSKHCVRQVGINAGPFFPEHELGWFVYEGFEGNGYAYEAAETLKCWAFKELRLPTLVSYIDPENAESCRLAERLHGTLDINAPREDPEDLVFRYEDDT
ncbi:GNAT family N-acetyltransferase [Pseudovibrio sp. JE062]|uniref:GNAT family N-acetyltransferase n=1 Tax=Pseudovibrio sp. JE062 TaxID=439495 RepID=UPI0009FD1644|nr:GNAT family N-acetyltransferase [Pseudovibrio sp. JE062]